MNRRIRALVGIGAATALAVAGFFSSDPAEATSQWSRKTKMECVDCHTVFPRLNPTGERYLQRGYEFRSAHDEEAAEEDVPILDDVSHLLGFRLNMTPLQWERNALLPDSTSSDRTGRLTIGSPIWIQFFAAGHLFPHVSFFSELEFAQSSFKFNWFYFNFTRLGDSQWANFQVGNISPLEFASYPNRLPQYPALKSEVMLLKSSAGKGDEGGADMSSARPGVQYFTGHPALVAYAGVSPGPRASDVNEELHWWGGLVGRLPEGSAIGGSTATLHYYRGTDTRNTGAGLFTNDWWRFSPQVNLRHKDKVDVQFAYVRGEEDNRELLATPLGKSKIEGTALEASYMPNWRWQFGAHHDWFEAEDGSGLKTSDYQRVVPGITYVLNQNWRVTGYYEHDLNGTNGSRGPGFNNRFYFNVRTMF